MLLPGPARKIIIHLNEDATAETGFAYEEVLALLLKSGVAGATLTRPEAGFGSHHRLHEKQWQGSHNQHLPVRIEFIESQQTLESLLPALLEIVKDGLIEAQDTSLKWRDRRTRFNCGIFPK
jgi:uncharacterized protein